MVIENFDFVEAANTGHWRSLKMALISDAYMCIHVEVSSKGPVLATNMIHNTELVQYNP